MSDDEVKDIVNMFELYHYFLSPLQDACFMYVFDPNLLTHRILLFLLLLYKLTMYSICGMLHVILHLSCMHVDQKLEAYLLPDRHYQLHLERPLHPE